MDSKKVDKKKKRKVYEKPRLRTINLEAEEVLAVGCKIASGGTTGIVDQPQCGINIGCATAGS